jgi:hypothetical protein
VRFGTIFWMGKPYARRLVPQYGLLQ